MQKTNTVKADAIHLLLDQEAIRTVARYEDDIYYTYNDTYNELKQGLREIYTTIPHFLNFKYAKKAFRSHRSYNSRNNTWKMSWNNKGNKKNT